MHRLARPHVLLAACALVALALSMPGCGPRETPEPGTSSPASEGTEHTEPISSSPRVDERPDDADLVVSDEACTTDADCVPAQCCHAAACVARANAPSCGDAMCTQECRARTMDCGGGCLCREGRCAARLFDPGAALGGLRE